MLVFGGVTPWSEYCKLTSGRCCFFFQAPFVFFLQVTVVRVARWLGQGEGLGSGRHAFLGRNWQDARFVALVLENLGEYIYIYIMNIHIRIPTCNMTLLVVQDPVIFIGFSLFYLWIFCKKTIVLKTSHLFHRAAIGAITPRVITVITPQLSIYFRPFIGAPKLHS